MLRRGYFYPCGYVSKSTGLQKESRKMRGKQSFRLSLLLLLGATPVLAQDSVTPPPQQSSRTETELRQGPQEGRGRGVAGKITAIRSEEHTSELQSRFDLVCRLLLEKKN